MKSLHVLWLGKVLVMIPNMELLFSATPSWFDLQLVLTNVKSLHLTTTMHLILPVTNVLKLFMSNFLNLHCLLQL
jgi:hypothetical protein